MKRFFLILNIFAVLTSCGSTKSIPTTSVKSDLTKYNYVYVIPTSAVTSGIFIETSTVNPSEMISGYLMKKGYSLLPAINNELAQKTFIVSYGNTGSTSFSSSLVAKKKVLIQFSDAETHEIIASSEAEGTSLNTETEALVQAIKRALDSIFDLNKLPIN